MAVRTNKTEWLAQRLADEQARGLYGNKRFDWSTNQWVKPDGTPTKGPKPPNPFGREGSLAKTLNQQLRNAVSHELGKKGPTRAEIDNAVREGKTLVATIPSTCFSDVYYEDGICTCVFARDGYVWEEEMSVDDFLDLADGPSLGVNWNADWRD